MVGGDDLTGIHQACRDVGDVALEAHQRTGPGDGRLIEDLIALMDGDKTRALRTLLAGDDGPGAIGLSCEGLVVPGRALLGVYPYRSPRAWMGVRVPHRLSLETLVPLAPRAPSGGDGVNVDCRVFFGQCLFVFQAAFFRPRNSLSTSSGVRYPRAE